MRKPSARPRQFLNRRGAQFRLGTCFHVIFLGISLVCGCSPQKDKTVRNLPLRFHESDELSVFCSGWELDSDGSDDCSEEIWIRVADLEGKETRKERLAPIWAELSSLNWKEPVFSLTGPTYHVVFVDNENNDAMVGTVFLDGSDLFILDCTNACQTPDGSFHYVPDSNLYIGGHTPVLCKTVRDFVDKVHEQPLQPSRKPRLAVSADPSASSLLRQTADAVLKRHAADAPNP